MTRIRPYRISQFLLLFGLGILVIPQVKFASPSQAQSPQIQAGLSVQGFISADSATQDWEFTPTSDQTLTVLINRFSGDLDPMVAVVDSDGEVIAENDDRIPDFVLDAGIGDVEFSQGETYTIRVGGHRGAGDYRLWLVPSFIWVQEVVSFDGDASRWNGRFVQQQAESLVLHTEEQGTRSVYVEADGSVPRGDFYLQAEFEWLTGQADSEATVGLVVRVEDDGTQRPLGYYFLMLPDGQWTVRRVSGGGIDELQALTASDLLASEQIALGVKADGSTLGFYANGELLGEFEDEVGIEGDWGFVLENRSLPVSVQIDNVLLTVPEQDVLDFPETIQSWQSAQPADIAAELASHDIIRENGRRALTILSTSYQVAGLRTAFYSQSQEGIEYTNLVMGVDVQFEGDNLACGVGLRAVDAANQVLAYTDLDGGMGLVDVVDGQLRHNAYDFQDEIDNPLPNGTRRLLVVAEGDWLALYVSGQLFEVQFSPIRRGRVGVALLNYSTSVGRCVYSDFWIWQS